MPFEPREPDDRNAGNPAERDRRVAVGGPRVSIVDFVPDPTAVAAALGRVPAPREENRCRPNRS